MHMYLALATVRKCQTTLLWTSLAGENFACMCTKREVKVHIYLALATIRKCPLILSFPHNESDPLIRRFPHGASVNLRYAGHYWSGKTSLAFSTKGKHKCTLNFTRKRPTSFEIETTGKYRFNLHWRFPQSSSAKLRCAGITGRGKFDCICTQILIWCSPPSESAKLRCAGHRPVLARPNNCGLQALSWPNLGGPSSSF